jgi:glycosyltransferase involved in cell wall biosynthesis
VAWGAVARIPNREVADGISVYHPRYLALPGLGRALDGVSEALALGRLVRALHRAGRADVVLATWAYPDVCAAALLARRLGVPLVAKVHGSDVNNFAQRWPRRGQVATALSRAACVVAVSRSLRQAVGELGVGLDRVVVVPNGVDTSRFSPLDATAARSRLGLRRDGAHVVFVGGLRHVKGPDVLVVAARRLDEGIAVTLVGEGPLRGRIERRIREAGLNGRVTLAGARPHEEIPLWLNAADVVCVPSRSEGFSNVTLEALACGRPVIGSRTGALPDLVSGPEYGVLVPPGDAPALAAALLRSLDRVWDAGRIRLRAAGLDWQESADALHEVLRDAAGAGTAAPA